MKYRPCDSAAIRQNGDAVKYNSEKDCFIIPDEFELLVDCKLWEKCQRRLKENRKNSGPAKPENAYHLSGLIRCGHCGYPMHGRRRTSGNRPLYYLCSKYNGTCKCKPHSIRQDVLPARRTISASFTPTAKAFPKTTPKPAPRPFRRPSQ